MANYSRFDALVRTRLNSSLALPHLLVNQPQGAQCINRNTSALAGADLVQKHGWEDDNQMIPSGTKTNAI